MSNETRKTSLRRLTRGGRPAPEYGEINPAKALRLALAKAGQSVLNQVVDGSGIEEQRVTLETLPDALAQDGLTVLLHGPDEGRGLINLDRSVSSAIIEGLTTGRIRESSGSDRAPTLTDALLCQRFLVTLLTVFAAKLVGLPAAEWATGFVPEDPVDDMRRLPILMDDELYRVLRVTVDIAGGQRTGQMTLVLPLKGRLNDAAEDKQTENVDEDEEWSRSLARAVEPSQVPLEAVLYRVTLPLSEVREFKEEMIIRIPASCIAEVSLEDRNRTCVSKVRLGQFEGVRAVRFDKGPDLDDLSTTDDLSGDGEPSADSFSLADAMAQVPGMTDAESTLPDPPVPVVNQMQEEEPLELPVLNGDFPPLDDLPDLPDLSDADTEGDAEGLPPLDLDSLPMTELDDLPMTID